MDVVRLMLPVRALDLVARCLTFNTFFLRTVETDHSTPLPRVCNGTRGGFPRSGLKGTRAEESPAQVYVDVPVLTTSLRL